MWSIKNFLFATFIILIPFQDTFLQKTALRSFGTSFAVIPLTFLILFSSIEWMFRRKLNVPKGAVVCGGYILAISLLYYVLDGFAPLDNTVLKFITLSILTAFFLFVIYALPYDQTALLRRATTFTFVIALLAIPLSDIHIAGLGFLGHTPILHATDNPDQRWRGFSSESSVFSILIITLGISSAHLAKRRSSTILLLVLTGLGLVGCGSKGGILSLLLTAPIIALLRMSGFWKKILVILLLIPTGLVIYTALLYLFPANLLSVSTTLPTRSTGILWALIVFLHNPFGVGFSGFYPAIREYMPAAMDMVRINSPVPLNFTEVRDYIQTGQDASSKVLILNYMVFFGLPFLILFTREVRRTTRALLLSDNLILLSGLICVLIAVASYIDSTVAYNIPFLLGLSVYERRKFENSTCNERFSVSAESWRARGYVGPAARPT